MVNLARVHVNALTLRLLPTSDSHKAYISKGIL